MAVIFNSFYRMVKKGNLQAMPAPCDPETPDVPWHVDKVREMASGLARIGFTDVLYPVLTMAQGGSSPNADGYGKQFDYDFGDARPTRWGYRKDTMRSVASCRVAGLRVLSDMVIHQYDGGDNGVYSEPMFPKHPACFVGPPPRVPADPVFDAEGNAAFGDMVAYVNGRPKGYMLDGIIAAINTQRRAFDLDGYRLDDTKGENAAVSREIIAATGGYVFGECFTGNRGELEAWVQQTSGYAGALDFSFHWALQAVCDRGASFRTLEDAGLSAIDPAHAVTFVDTGDTDNNDGENIKFNKLWAYVLILTTEGTPMVYARDYLAEPNCYGLKPEIDTMVWINRAFAFGKTQTRFLDDNAFVYTRDGDGGQYGWSGGLLVGLNGDPIATRTLTVATGFGPHVQLHDYTGHGWDVWTDGDGLATITIPPNVNGSAKSYVCYARADVEYAPPINRRSTTQEIVGDQRLSVKPVRNGAQTLPYPLYCAKSSHLRVSLEMDKAGVSSSATVEVQLTDPKGTKKSLGRITGGAPKQLEGEIDDEGWYSLHLIGALLPEAGLKYNLNATYMGAAR